MGVKDQGVQSGRWAVIPRVLIFVFRGEQVLLIKGAATKKVWANRYNGLGGHIERGEDALTAARRELAEESGLERINLHLAGSVLIDTGAGTGIELFVFVGELENDQELIHSIEGELAWVRMHEIDKLPAVDDLPQILSLVSQRRSPGSGLFHARYQYDAADQLEISVVEEAVPLS